MKGIRLCLLLGRKEDMLVLSLKDTSKLLYVSAFAPVRVIQ